MALLKGTIKSALKLLLLVPLVLLVLWVNYFVDQTGLFRGDKFNLELAQILLEGDPVSNFEKMDEREVLKLYIKNMPEAYNTVVIGSSRGLQITAAIAGESGSFTIWECRVRTFMILPRLSRCWTSMIGCRRT